MKTNLIHMNQARTTIKTPSISICNQIQLNNLLNLLSLKLKIKAIKDNHLWILNLK